MLFVWRVRTCLMKMWCRVFLGVLSCRAEKLSWLLRIRVLSADGRQMPSGRGPEASALRSMLIFRSPDRVRSLTSLLICVGRLGRWVPSSRLTQTAFSKATLVGWADVARVPVATRPGVDSIRPWSPSNMLEGWVAYGYGAKCHALNSGDTMQIHGEAAYAQRHHSTSRQVLVHQGVLGGRAVRGSGSGRMRRWAC